MLLKQWSDCDELFARSTVCSTTGWIPASKYWSKHPNIQTWVYARWRHCLYPRPAAGWVKISGWFGFVRSSGQLLIAHELFLASASTQKRRKKVQGCVRLLKSRNRNRNTLAIMQKAGDTRSTHICIHYPTVGLTFYLFIIYLFNFPRADIILARVANRCDIEIGPWS